MLPPEQADGLHSRLTKSMENDNNLPLLPTTAISDPEASVQMDEQALSKETTTF